MHIYWLCCTQSNAKKYDLNLTGGDGVSFSNKTSYNGSKESKY